MASPATKTDVMIAYDSQDYQITKKMADALRGHGLTVWYLDPKSDASTATLEKGQALVYCKVFLLLVSPASVSNEHLKDEVALAYISNKVIIPASLRYFRAISPHLDGGIKLMLAKINWIFFVKPEEFDNKIKDLLEVIRPCIAGSGQSSSDHLDDEGGQYTNRLNTNQVNDQSQLDEDMRDQTTSGEGQDFWDRHFKKSKDVTWIEFREKFIRDYGQRITDQFGEEKHKWFIQLIYKDIFFLYKVISRDMYDKFAGKNDQKSADHFYDHLKDFAIAKFAMLEVFGMDSSVRLTAIQNLGSFHSGAVLSALLDLTDDQDPNIRAVAALALAKTGRKTKKIADKLIRLLQDEDRLVRESACLSLGHMKCEAGVPGIIDLWRNDAIKHVREAADLALIRIGGEEADRAIKVTKVLSTEMENLRAARRN